MMCGGVSSVWIDLVDSADHRDCATKYHFVLCRARAIHLPDSVRRRVSADGRRDPSNDNR